MPNSAATAFSQSVLPSAPKREGRGDALGTPALKGCVGFFARERLGQRHKTVFGPMLGIASAAAGGQGSAPARCRNLGQKGRSA